MNPLTQQIGDAIAQMEGFYQPGSIAQRQNNPGNLRSWGSNAVVNGYAQFPSVDAGWSALYQQIELNISRGLSLREFFAGKPGVYRGYSPSADGNRPLEYAQYVAGRLGGVPIEVPISQLSGDSPGNPSRPPGTGTPRRRNKR